MKACLDLLAIHRIWHHRVNTGFFKLEGKNGPRVFRAGKPGMADILSTPIPSGGAPIVLWIECKSSDGSQREDQEDFEVEVRAAGHEYLLVNDVQYLIDWLKLRRVI
jgi:hypothetical protein